MTDRIRTVTVVLDADYRDDDVIPILTALRMVRGVASVEARVVEGADYTARLVTRAMCLDRALDAVREAFNAD